ncbi:GGDEF domain-containing protein [Terriglobus roseus]|uniref:diguanylate cyclase n=1 Tax=Terriglobus roseus TaxID=392734 RepID=A0A1H4ITC4_9BACT|nr:GGDEF domain-containing protein [Terriglobus roseus]SEB37344.1 diguanylate cyclase (GGDEF) domain-containing protein [Terriglobus roseus]
MLKRSPLHAFAPTDPDRLEGLAPIQRVCLALVFALAAVILCGWLIPSVGRHLPTGWSLMKANTAVLALLSAGSLGGTLPGRSDRTVTLSRWLGLAVSAVALSVLVEYVFGVSLGLDTLLAADALAAQPGRMAPQTATIFCLLGLLMATIRARKRLLSLVADVILFALCLMVLSVASGYIFGALRLFGTSLANRTSPQTLAVLVLLCFVAFLGRAGFGSFGILLGVGTGGRIARIASPIALTLPFVLGATMILMIRTGQIDLRYATAIIASIASMLAFGTVVVLARLIETQEAKIRDLSLRDGLTELYNRRGFYIHAEQALRLAQRSREPFSVLFIDLDNLKAVNDSLGHEAGSVFLREVSDLLRATFRSTEIMGRIGGDEFAVAIGCGKRNLETVALRLKLAASKQNSLPSRLYPFSFSLGSGTVDPDELQSLDDLLASADRAMYSEKLRNKVETLFSGARLQA